MKHTMYSAAAVLAMLGIMWSAAMNSPAASRRLPQLNIAPSACESVKAGMDENTVATMVGFSPQVVKDFKGTTTTGTTTLMFWNAGDNSVLVKLRDGAVEQCYSGPYKAERIFGDSSI